jgi:hypothetical protein
LLWDETDGALASVIPAFAEMTSSVIPSNGVVL